MKNWWLIGYVVSVVVAYVSLWAVALWRRTKQEEPWTLGDRITATCFALFAPAALLIIAYMIGDKLRNDIDWDKEAKW